ncbi:telomerase protein component 1-like, partial [Cetorhinus maximus]
MATDGGGLSGPDLPGPRLLAGHLLTPSAGLRPLSACAGLDPLTRPESRELSGGLENRLLRRPVLDANSWAVSSTLPLSFSQPLSPKLPHNLCTSTSTSLTLRPLTSPPLTLLTLTPPPLTLHPLTSPLLTLRPLTSPPLTLHPLTSPSLKIKPEQPSPGPECPWQQEAQTENSIKSEQWPAEDPAEASELLPSYSLSAEEYEDLEQARGALVDEELHDVPDPSQSRDARLRGKKEALLNGICCSLVQGAKFTDAEDESRLELLGLCREIAEQEPEFVLKVALYARQELNLRSPANFLLALSAWLQPCRPHLRRYFCPAVRLPSDWIEVAKIYQSLAESSRKVAPYPSCLRQALADSFKLFDEYQLAKYNTRKQRCKSSPRRQKQVAESSPTVKENKPVDHFSLKKLVRWLHLKEPTYHIMCLLGRSYPSDLQSFARSRLPGPWDSLRAGKRMKFLMPETWERQVSLQGNTAKVWEELIDHQKLPFMAMLRNLRNVIVAGVSRRHHQWILERLTDT